jgi:hypothetical protein
MKKILLLLSALAAFTSQSAPIDISAYNGLITKKCFDKKIIKAEFSGGAEVHIENDMCVHFISQSLKPFSMDIYFSETDSLEYAVTPLTCKSEEPTKPELINYTLAGSKWGKSIARCQNLSKAKQYNDTEYVKCQLDLSSISSHITTLVLSGHTPKEEYLVFHKAVMNIAEWKSKHQKDQQGN